MFLFALYDRMPTTMSTRTMMASRCSRPHRKVPKRKDMPAKRDPIRSRMRLQPSNNIMQCKQTCRRRRQRRRQTLWPPVHPLATSPEARVVCRCWQTTTMSGQMLLTDSFLEIVLLRVKSSNRHQRQRRQQRQCTVPSVRVFQVNRTRDADYNNNYNTVRRTTVHLDQ